MQRVTITIDDELDEELDRFMKARGYANRSEAIRDLARSGLQQRSTEIAGARPCVAALVYLYDHEARELPKRLTRDFHDRHDLAHSTLHVHLDHENCMEVTMRSGQLASPMCSNSPTASFQNGGYATARWSICRPTVCTRTMAARATPIHTATRTVTAIRTRRNAARPGDSVTAHSSFFPARGEKVGMRGPIRRAEIKLKRSDSRKRPLTLASLDLSPHAGR